jgi:hypothetical protein
MTLPAWRVAWTAANYEFANETGRDGETTQDTGAPSHPQGFSGVAPRQ